MRTDLAQVLALAGEGRINVPVAGRFGLSDATGALTFAEAGGLAGKVVIVPDPAAESVPRS